MTLTVGIIGTSWITQQFIDAVHETGKYELAAIYSRHQERADEFNAQNNNQATTYTDLATFMAADFDVVYIASPNGLHFEQIMLAIENEKHVIVEKPAVANPKEFEKVYSTLRQHPNVRYFEAARHIHQANFKAITAQMAKMELIQGATLVYNKYSSRYDAYLRGENPNVLNPAFAGGALADLGVYPLYAAIAWFGLPKSSTYFATPLNNGGDARGTAILRYADFDVTLIFGKNSNSYLSSEIYGLQDTIVMDNVAELNTVTYHTDGKHAENIGTPAPANPMTTEANVFADIINDFDNHQTEYNDLLVLSQRVNLVLYDLRKSAGIVFPADK
ncbi:Gfo/Idh/MocA family oxidoreductase [Periweissella cryptocerci]|uniref:Gfo/Idh/MocA family oxidoreductase n=1 Tax=Periweissella cryptocerci TaxID=2506420 RepID=A0A4P6YSH0_9LACO|nr:Gfo/Idh/MocA family oxidoreductase [Periweissella cryptocerci]QBO35590.1 Gfo/Idh/MocA family oxidoreductase [Periweissella cryptocerci]